ncbi:MAG: 2-hydroxyacid dehydrogenase [Elusimicrobia bacterium]|nr:2-hydroxyacid dehydrogenase [Elusimicrobiota bacterium]
MKVALYDARPYDIECFGRINRNFGFEINYFREHLNRDTAVLSSGASAVCAFVNDVIDREVIDKLLKNSVSLIALRSAGYNNVDLRAAFGKIHVCRVPAYSPYAVAEHAVALMLTLNRKIHKAFYRTRDNNFNINGLLGFDMHGKTAGIIGTGKIGKVLIDILSGFGMKILAYDVYRDQEYALKKGFEYVSLDELYAKSDIISVNCPLTKETYHLINKKAVDRMKPGVMIINTGRGKVIDTAALIAGLKDRKIGSAGLDVYEEESQYFFEDFSSEVIGDDMLARLLTFTNVLVTSHQAFFTKEALDNIADTTLNNISDFFKKGEIPNEICYHCERGPCLKKKEGKCF